MCGGLGTRLRPWSNVIPKPMFPIGERPILELLLEQLRGERSPENHVVKVETKLIVRGSTKRIAN